MKEAASISVDSPEYIAEDTKFLGHPRPLSGLFFTEFWERFSYYGVRAILVLFMTTAVHSSGLGLDSKTASAIAGIFGGSVYLLALPGGWIADHWLGQKKAVWYGCLLIALGHLSIALMLLWGTRMFFIGMVLIALGSGLFKTCITVMVGSLYKDGDGRRDAGFSIFYMGINLGAFFAPFLTGFLAGEGMWHLGFGVGGLGMLIALLIFRFWAMPAMDRYVNIAGVNGLWEAPKPSVPHVGATITALMLVLASYIFLLDQGYLHFSPVAVSSWLIKLTAIALVGYFAVLFIFSKLTANERQRLALCFLLLLSAIFFWAAFEQQPTSYNLFAMHYTDRHVLGFEVPVGWVQSINSFFVITVSPLFAWMWLSLAKKKISISFTSKFVAGLLCGAAGFAIMILAALTVQWTGKSVSLLWLTASLFFLTCGELFLSPVGLSAMSQLAPSSMKGQIMGLWTAGISLGNLAAGLIGGHVNAESLADLPGLFGSVTVSLLICAVLLVLLAIPINRLLARH